MFIMIKMISLVFLYAYQFFSKITGDTKNKKQVDDYKESLELFRLTNKKNIIVFKSNESATPKSTYRFFTETCFISEAEREKIEHKNRHRRIFSI